mmetsp:Transcript_1848/g.6070  ORF Transcript_1848/g.6070 Transcript_1848/m.6070 type:complete len:242 (+) Transcript_1848:1806-2531(+)|eukprot:30385-Pelagococcus_subviridis.AAC.4
MTRHQGPERDPPNRRAVRVLEQRHLSRRQPGVVAQHERGPGRQLAGAVRRREQHDHRRAAEVEHENGPFFAVFFVFPTAHDGVEARLEARVVLHGDPGDGAAAAGLFREPSGAALLRVPRRLFAAAAVVVAVVVLGEPQRAQRVERRVLQRSLQHARDRGLVGSEADDLAAVDAHDAALSSSSSSFAVLIIVLLAVAVAVAVPEDQGDDRVAADAVAEVERRGHAPTPHVHAALQEVVRRE